MFCGKFGNNWCKVKRTGLPGPTWVFFWMSVAQAFVSSEGCLLGVHQYQFFWLSLLSVSHGVGFFSRSWCLLVGGSKLHSGFPHACLGLGTAGREAGCEVMCQKGSLFFSGTPFKPKCPNSWIPHGYSKAVTAMAPKPALCTWRAAPVGGSTWGHCLLTFLPCAVASSFNSILTCHLGFEDLA